MTTTEVITPDLKTVLRRLSCHACSTPCPSGSRSRASRG